MADLKISQLTGATTPLAGTEVLPIVQGGATKKVSVDNLTAGKAVSALNITTSTTSVTAGTFTGKSTAIPGTSGFWNNTVAGLDLYDSDGTAGYGVGIRFRPNIGGVYPVAGIAALAPSTTTSDLVVHTQSANGTVSEVFRFKATADVTFNLGNLIQGTAAKGVNFTANTPAAGMTSQLLNWYEEGTWTPSFTNCGTAAVGTALYTRIGRLVTINMTMTATSIVKNSSFFTLPFTCGLITSGTFVRSTDEGGFLEPQSNSVNCYFATTPTSTTGQFQICVTYTV